MSELMHTSAADQGAGVPPLAVGELLSDTDVDTAIAELERYSFGVEDAESGAPRRVATIGAIIPAYNEQDTIKQVLRGLLAQSRLPDVIHVIVNNTSDKTFKRAKKFAGPHTHVRNGVEHTTKIFVHDIGKNPDKKVGALNYGFRLVQDMDYLLGVDGDTVLDKHAVRDLEAEILSDSRIGGISAIYTLDNGVKGATAKFLLTGQRAQFAAFNMQNLLRGRNMAVLGGQCSLFSVAALTQVMRTHHQLNPWVSDSEVEDSLLSLQIKSLGYSTKISPSARATVGGMTTLRSLDGQQVKWNYGAIDLMWPGQRGDTKGQPLHPNLRLRWLENVGMLVNAVTRVAFLLLLAGSLSIGAFKFSPIWLIPPVVAAALNVRTAMSMRDRTWRDVLFAATLIPAEVYMWIKVGHFVRAWTKFLSNSRTDNWAAQARAERGAGWAYLTPFLFAAIAAGAIVWTWVLLPLSVQSVALTLGWPILGVITILQTVAMLRRLIRRQRGFKV